MKRFLLLFTFLLTVLVASAATIGKSTTFYFKPHANWTQANARFAVYFFDNANNRNAWVSMEKVDCLSGVYKATSPSGYTYANLIFCRMNPSNTSNSWSTKWNQTGDLTYDGTKNEYVLEGGEWE